MIATRLLTAALLCLLVSIDARPWRRTFSFRGGFSTFTPDDGEANTSPSPEDGDTSPPSSTNNDTATIIPEWKLQFPPILQQKRRNFRNIRLGNVNIFLLGTAHVSNDSSRDVKLLLDCVHPDAIFVELCDARIALLEKDNTHANETSSTKASLWERVREIQNAQGGTRMQALSSVLLTNVQEEYAKELGVELGGEFQVAYQYWKNKNSQSDVGDERKKKAVHLILGDRPLHLTLIRAWESLRWWPKVKVMAGLIWSCIRKPNKKEIQEWLDKVMREETDILTESFEELQRQFPTLYETIIHERDAWLSAKLVQACRALSRQSSQCTLVAIVGAGHVPGICQWLTNQTSLTPEQVLQQLVVTKRWMNDTYIQNEAIPNWIYQVTELQTMPDHAWIYAQPQVTS